MLSKVNRARLLATLLACVIGGAATPPVSAQGEDAGTATTAPSPVLSEFQRKLDFMAKRLAEVRPEAEPDVTAGSITLGQHQADVAEVRDEFVRCYAAVQQAIEEKKASGSATPEEIAQFEQFEVHCKSVLDKLNGMHLNATKMTMADRKTTWLVGALEAHKQMLAEVQGLAEGCPAVFQHALASSGAGAAAGHAAHAATSVIDEPSLHYREFQRKLDFMAARLAEIPSDPEGGDIREGAISLQQHAADVAATRDEFEKCLAGLKRRIAEKEASGTATRSDRAQFRKCVRLCESILAKLNHMHLNASIYSEADRKTKWVLDGMEAHREAVAEVQEMAAECSEMIHDALACCEIKE